jgi:hypothetical protein
MSYLNFETVIQLKVLCIFCRAVIPILIWDIYFREKRGKEREGAREKRERERESV